MRLLLSTLLAFSMMVWSEILWVNMIWRLSHCVLTMYHQGYTLTGRAPEFLITGNDVMDTIRMENLVNAKQATRAQKGKAAIEFRMKDSHQQVLKRIQTALPDAYNRAAAKPRHLRTDIEHDPETQPTLHSYDAILVPLSLHRGKVVPFPCPPGIRFDGSTLFRAVGGDSVAHRSASERKLFLGKLQPSSWSASHSSTST